MSTLNGNNNALLYMQFAICILLLIAWTYIFVTTGVSQPELASLLALCVGFFFGAETVDRINKARSR